MSQITPAGMQSRQLGNRLKKPAPMPKEDAPQQQDPTPKAHQPVGGGVTGSEPQQRKGRKEGPRRHASGAGTAFYVSPEMAARFRAEAARRRVTNGTLVLDAVEATVGELPPLLEGGTRTDSTGMFTRHVSAEPGSPRVQLSARFIRENLRVLDDLVDRLGAESRSQLIEAALKKYLPEDD